MTTYADADLPVLFPGMSETSAATREMLAAARAGGTIAKGVFGPIAIHHSDVTELLRDRRLRGPGMDFARMAGIPVGGRAWQRQEQILLFMEGDDHHRLRRLVSKAFTPKAVEALRPFTRTTIARLLDTVIDEGGCDVVPALCDPFPIPVICALVGVDVDRWEDMSRWATSILKSLRIDAGGHIDEIEQAQAELTSSSPS
ncbi:MAG: hypothetical protein Q7V88_04140 [Actinomycetota bacterium]|nr:hypothetical protein [Actinomycetota bacterium]